MPVEALVLYASPEVAAIGLDYIQGVQVAVAGARGKGKERPARMAEGVAYSLGDLKILGGRAIVLAVPKDLAAYHSGIIGAALFRHFVVAIDNDLQTLTLRRPEGYQPPEGATVLPFTLERGMPIVKARVRTGDGPAVSAGLVVDLGASHAVSLSAKDETGITIPKPSLEGAIGRGMSGELTGRIARLPEIDLGGQILRNLVATFPDDAHHSPRGMDSHEGNLGSGILSRFNVTFDYAEQRMVLVPTKRFAEPFEWDMTGMEAAPDEDGAVRVRRVPSPASHPRRGQGGPTTEYREYSEGGPTPSPPGGRGSRAQWALRSWGRQRGQRRGGPHSAVPEPGRRSTAPRAVRSWRAGATGTGLLTRDSRPRPRQFIPTP